MMLQAAALKRVGVAPLPLSLSVSLRPRFCVCPAEPFTKEGTEAEKHVRTVYRCCTTAVLGGQNRRIVVPRASLLPQLIQASRQLLFSGNKPPARACPTPFQRTTAPHAGRRIENQTPIKTDLSDETYYNRWDYRCRGVCRHEKILRARVGHQLCQPPPFCYRGKGHADQDTRQVRVV